MNLLQIPALLLAWCIYWLYGGASGWWLALLIVATVFVALKISSGLKRTAAANNLVFAAATFQTLDAAGKAMVEGKVMEIFGRMNMLPGGPNIEVDSARWGWYALAMMELGIPPFKGLPAWNVVPNPFTAIRPSDPYIKSTIERVRELGIDVGELISTSY